jgi:hypothetical protein
MVCPTMSGDIIEARDHVLITLLSPMLFSFRTFSLSFG